MLQLSCEIQQRNPEIRPPCSMPRTTRPTRPSRLLGSIRECRKSRIAIRPLPPITALSPRDAGATLIVAGTNEARHSINEIVAQTHAPGGGLKYTAGEVDATRAQSGHLRPDLVVSYHRGQKHQRGVDYAVVGVEGDHGAARQRRGQNVTVKPAQHFSATLHMNTTSRSRPRSAQDHQERQAARPAQRRPGAGAGCERRGRYRQDGARHHRGHPGAASHEPAARLRHHDPFLSGPDFQPRADRGHTRSLTTNRAAFYVAISRPRYELKLYTDRAAELRGAVARVPKKFAALELRTAHSEAHIAEQKHRQILLVA